MLPSRQFVINKNNKFQSETSRIVSPVLFKAKITPSIPRYDEEKAPLSAAGCCHCHPWVVLSHWDVSVMALARGDKLHGHVFGDEQRGLASRPCQEQHFCALSRCIIWNYRVAIMLLGNWSRVGTSKSAFGLQRGWGASYSGLLIPVWLQKHLWWLCRLSTAAPNHSTAQTRGDHC